MLFFLCRSPVIPTYHRPSIPWVKNRSPTIHERHPLYRKQNSVADAMSCKELSRIAATPIDFQELAANQEYDSEFAEITSNLSLHFECHPLFTCDGEIHCDISTGRPRPFVPQSHRRKIFDYVHRMSRASIRSTVKMIADRCIWKNIRQDIRQWAQ